MNSHQEFGKQAESIAVKHLKRNGYRIIQKNYRNKLGEIDIIAKDGKTLVFVEVKAKRTTSFGNPKYAVTPKKQRKISMVALFYLKVNGQIDSRARFDVVAISSADSYPEIEIIKNAFELAYE